MNLSDADSRVGALRRIHYAASVGSNVHDVPRGTNQFQQRPRRLLCGRLTGESLYLASDEFKVIVVPRGDR